MSKTTKILLAVLITAWGISAQSIVGTWEIGSPTAANVIATLTNDGTLTISGIGEMRGYNSNNSIYAPWRIHANSIKSVIVEDGVTNIGNQAFFTVFQYLTSVNISNSVKSIGNSAFYGCEKLTEINIPHSVKSIGNYAFSLCEKLTGELTIPNSVTSIGEGAFRYCLSLTSVIISDSVTTIEMDAFSVCTSLISITIPNSITSIKESAFSVCKSLNKIISLNAVPPTVASTYVFSQIKKDNCTIYVHGDESNVAAYRAAIGWKDFTNIEALGHDWKPATCETPKTCSFCSETEGEPDFMSGHNYGDWITITAATCTKTGVEERICSYGSDHMDYRNISALGHNYGGWTTINPATCTKSGVEARICLHDSDHMDYRNVSALGHSFPEMWSVVIAATETEFGEEERVCNADGCNEKEVRSIPMLDGTPINKIQKSDSCYGIRFSQNIVNDKAEISVVLPNNEKATQTKLVVYDMTGNIVFETTTRGRETIFWNLTNNAGRIVANGSYLVIAEVKAQNGQCYRYSAKLGVKR